MGGKPVTRNNNPVGKGGCTIISSKCIVWSGPDIECLNLCAGDSIDEVTYQLALKVCTLLGNMIDFTKLEFACIVPEGAPTPDDITELLNLIIEQVCDIRENCCGETPGECTCEEPVLPLPECLYIHEVGKPDITELPRNDYIVYLASVICQAKLVLIQINADITAIQGRLSNIEAWILSFPGQEDILVTTQCLSGPVAGVETEISVAFEYMETVLCTYVDVLGTPTELAQAITFECSRLSAMPQLADPDHTMSELTGWVETPDTIADSLTNAWLAICDLRARVEICCFENELCAPLPPTNIVISDETSDGCTITWTAPSTPSTEDPTGYYIEIWQWDGIQVVGQAPVVSDTVAAPTTTYTTTGIIDNSVWYVIYVTALYDGCDDSAPLTYYGYAALPQYLYCLDIQESLEEVANTCDAGATNYNEATIIVTLKDYNTHDTVVNSGDPISIIITLLVTDTCTQAITTEDVEVIIATGNSTGTVVYDQDKLAVCGESCAEITKEISCILSISEENIGICETYTMCPPN